MPFACTCNRDESYGNCNLSVDAVVHVTTYMCNCVLYACESKDGSDVGSRVTKNLIPLIINFTRCPR